MAFKGRPPYQGRRVRSSSWKLLAAFFYQSSFKANCTCLDVVEVLVIAPAVPETPVGVKTIRFGVLKFARFSRLKSSARNWIVSRSLTAVFLIVEKSHVASPGPLTESLPRFP